MEKLRFHYGTELTFHQPTRRFSRRNLRYSALKKLTDELQVEFGCNARWTADVHQTFEVHSPPIENWATFKRFYRFVTAQAKREKLPIKGRGWSTGGGHLHVSEEQPWPKELKLFIIEDRANRPYLTWVFNDPEDMSICHELTQLDEYQLEEGEAKIFAITIRRRTIEFRLFEMPRNWDEQVLHIMFCEAYLSWAKGREVPGLLPHPEWTFDSAKGAFNDFLAEIGLDPYLYSVFVNCNLKARFRP